ncbi:MAG TPA: crotonase/enoyl-CoA hydratase family protein [Acidimicrobiales bacterium]|nr:crotonase/enoyl-CoA hydratase family protein [Acidimicrobiales bacterium]
MSDSVTYERRDAVALVTIDDGKANALSFEVLAALGAALDRAEADGAGAVLITGRPGTLSGGFDLKVMRGGDLHAIADLVTTGGELFLRLYRSPMPVVAGCTGHAVAAGALLLLGAHHRVGADGDFRIQLVETAIGMVLPDWAVELGRARLSARHVEPACIEAFPYAPAAAVDAGFLDRVVPPAEVLEAGLAEAARLAALPAGAYAGNAAKVRGPALERIGAAVAADRAGR